MNLKNIIQQPEGRRLEFKEKLPDKADLNKTIIAFANDAGGVLFIGIKDFPREIVGISEDRLLKIEEQISNLIYDNCYPIISPDISIVNYDGKFVIKVQVYRGSNLPYYLKSKGKNKGTYIRVGSSNRLANEDIILEMERLKRNISFDSEAFVEINYPDIDFTNFEKIYKRELASDLNESSLKKLKLIQEVQSKYKATNALLLLSDDELKDKFFPYAKIECARFKGTSTDVFIDQKTLNGNILEQIEFAYEFVLRHINKGAKVEGVYTKHRWEYPVKAIRETIRNAVVHRDYSLSGKDIKIAIYDDMVEITSPGKLLPTIDFNEMEARQSDIRNKVIAPVFKHLGLIDQWGNGLKLIKDELSTYQDIEFKWKETGIQFQVQFIKKDYKSKAYRQDELKTSILHITTKSRLSHDQVTTILKFCKQAATRKSILEIIEYKNHTDNYKKYILPLIENDLLQFTIPDTPKSSKQKYKITEKGLAILGLSNN
ncbi:MAG: ATP-dependent DNA helicase [Bacteroidetes bacterium]|nr:MAG: ATP-dependent DNA helicase [Bacteroidota bacterium]